MLLKIESGNNIEELGGDIYCIKVPLPDNPLRQLNSYLLKGDRNLLIDTGFNLDECENVLTGSLDSLDINLDETDILVTHLHGDHAGLLARLRQKGMTFYSSEADGLLINYGAGIEYWLKLEDIFIKHGYPEEACMSTSKNHPGRKFNHGYSINFTYLKDGDTIKVGKNELKCIITPGHTPGHLCLYSEKEKVLFSGDHVLGDITPNICPEVGMDDPLTAYLESLERIKEFDIRAAYPGHRRMIHNFYERVDTLIEHHKERLDEVIEIVGEGKQKNAYEVAQKMTWSISCDEWEDFPRPQKWFATGEAISHLQHLFTNNRIERKIIEGKYFFQA